MAEYLQLGTLVVCVLDARTQSVRRYPSDQPALTLGPDDELTFPECLPGLSIVIRRFFE